MPSKKNAPLSALARMMQEKDIKLSATYLHVDFFDDNGVKMEYPMDKWYILVEYQGKSYGSFYRAGLGNRIPFGYGKDKVRHERGAWIKPGTGERVSDAEAVKRGWLSLPKEGPPSDQILHCFLSDASGVEQSFKSWCSDMGGNPDSLSQLNIYLKCQEVRDAFLRIFGLTLMNELLEAGQDL